MASITVQPELLLERVLTLEIVRVTERAAVSSARLRGRGQEKAADQAAVDAMRREDVYKRQAKEAMLFSEVSEGFHAYGVGHHRHMAELDQEFSLAAGREVIVSFTPHLVPMNRGILSTIYVRGRRGRTPEELHALLLKFYAKEPFVHVLPFGELSLIHI